MDEVYDKGKIRSRRKMGGRARKKVPLPQDEGLIIKT